MIRVIEYVNLLKSKRSKAYSTSITAFNVYGTPGRMPPLVQFTPSRPTESSLRMSRHKKFVRPIAPRGLKNDPILSASAPQARPTRAEASPPFFTPSSQVPTKTASPKASPKASPRSNKIAKAAKAS